MNLSRLRKHLKRQKNHENDCLHANKWGIGLQKSTENAERMRKLEYLRYSGGWIAKKCKGAKTMPKFLSSAMTGPLFIEDSRQKDKQLVSSFTCLPHRR